MQELIQALVAKAGVTEEQAVKSVETIKQYIQSKLPPMMHGVIDNFLGSANAGSQADDVIDITGK
jgi:nucleoid DNA-binding protein